MTTHACNAMKLDNASTVFISYLTLSDLSLNAGRKESRKRKERKRREGKGKKIGS